MEADHECLSNAFILFFCQAVAIFSTCGKLEM